MGRVTVRVPGPLQPFAGGAAELAVEAGTVRDALAGISAGRPGLAQRVLTPEGALRPYVNVFVNERNCRLLQGLDTPLSGGETLAIIPAVAGG